MLSGGGVQTVERGGGGSYDHSGVVARQRISGIVDQLGGSVALGRGRYSLEKHSWFNKECLYECELVGWLYRMWVGNPAAHFSTKGE